MVLRLITGLLLFVSGFYLEGQTITVIRSHSNQYPGISWVISPDKNIVSTGDIITVSITIIPESGFSLFGTQTQNQEGLPVANIPTELIFVKESSRNIMVHGGLLQSILPAFIYNEFVDSWECKFPKNSPVTFTQKFRITGPNPSLRATLRLQACLPELCRYYEIPIAPTLQSKSL